MPDGYDYYPAYEVYYSRSRRDYVYREGNTWVRRPEPRGVRLAVLTAAPSVRLDFQDSPEQHHRAVVKQYPRNWKRPDKDRDDKDDRNKNNNGKGRNRND